MSPNPDSAIGPQKTTAHLYCRMPYAADDDSIFAGPTALIVHSNGIFLGLGPSHQKSLWTRSGRVKYFFMTRPRWATTKKQNGGDSWSKKIFKDLGALNGPNLRTRRRRVQNVLDWGSLNPNYFYTSRPRPAPYNFISPETANGILWGLGLAATLFLESAWLTLSTKILRPKTFWGLCYKFL